MTKGDEEDWGVVDEETVKVLEMIEGRKRKGGEGCFWGS